MGLSEATIIALPPSMSHACRVCPRAEVLEGVGCDIQGVWVCGYGYGGEEVVVGGLVAYGGSMGNGKWVRYWVI